MATQPINSKDYSTTSTLGPLAKDEYLRSSYDLDISGTITPLSEIRMLKPGEASRAKDLEIKQWDKGYNTGPYALIRKPGEKPEGWASWGLYYDKFCEHSFKNVPILPAQAHINVLMRHLRDYHGALISRGEDPNKDEIIGTVFPLNLNRHLVRSFFYYWILGLETRVVYYVGLMYPTDDKFRPVLNSILRDQVEKVERIRLQRRRAGETRVRLSDCLYLWQALRILNGETYFAKIKWLINEDFKVDKQDAQSFSAQDLKNATIDDLVDFRNLIMHPMSLLVTNDEGSIAELVKKYVLVKTMAQILDAKILIYGR
jgi:hypothetical protein